MLDNIKTIQTPEGVTLHLSLAGPVTRFIAWSIDFGIKIGILFSFAMFLPLFGGFGQGVLAIIFFIVWEFYGIYYEARRGGMTPGKKAMGIKVVYDNGTPVDLSGAFARNLLRAVDMLPFCYSFGLIAMLSNKSYKRLGDLAAGTIVVYCQSANVAGQIPVMAAHAPALLLTPDEQCAVVDFAERTSLLSQERVFEIAAVLAPVLKVEEQQCVPQLLGYANWIVGKR